MVQLKTTAGNAATSFLLLFLFFIPQKSEAQRTEDVVYLSDGSVIRGVIISDSTSSKILILNHAGDTWAFDPGEIDSVTAEKKYEYKALIFNKPGAEFSIKGEFLIRSGNNAIGKSIIPGIGMSAGMRINSFFSAGASTGMQFYDQMELPFSLYFRARISDRAMSPFASFYGGYTVPAEKRENDYNYSYKGRGGMHYSIGAGFERIINESTSLLFSLSYHYQELNYRLTPLHPWVQGRDRTETYSRFRISVGYVFK
jgi:hypothetical protein